MGVKFFIKLFTDSSWRKKCIAITAIFYNLAATLYRSYELTNNDCMQLAIH